MSCSHALVPVRVTLCTLEKATIVPFRVCLPSLKIHTTFDWLKAPVLAYCSRVLQFSLVWQSSKAGATQYTLCSAVVNPAQHERSWSTRSKILILPISVSRLTVCVATATIYLCYLYCVPESCVNRIKHCYIGRGVMDFNRLCSWLVQQGLRSPKGTFQFCNTFLFTHDVWVFSPHPVHWLPVIGIPVTL